MTEVRERWERKRREEKRKRERKALRKEGKWETYIWKRRWEQKMLEARKRERGRGETRTRMDPGVREYWAPPRRVGPTPTIPWHQRTDSHRVHAALTYIQPAFTTGETACRSNKRGPGHARRARPTTCVRESISPDFLRGRTQTLLFRLWSCRWAIRSRARLWNRNQRSITFARIA